MNGAKGGRDAGGDQVGAARRAQGRVSAPEAPPAGDRFSVECPAAVLMLLQNTRHPPPSKKQALPPHPARHSLARRLQHDGGRGVHVG